MRILPDSDAQGDERANRHEPGPAASEGPTDEDLELARLIALEALRKAGRQKGNPTST